MFDVTLSSSFLEILSEESICQKYCVELALAFWPVSQWVWAWNRAVFRESTVLVTERNVMHIYSPLQLKD